MEFLLPYLNDYYLLPYLLLFVRVGSIFGLLSVFSGSTIPVNLKVVMVFWLTLFFASTILTESEFERIHDLFKVNSLYVLIANEFVIGVFVTAILNLFFYAYKTIGEYVTFAVGLSMAQIYDPSSGAQEPVFAKFFWILTIYIFFNSEFYYLLIVGFQNLINTIPLGELVYDKVNYVHYLINKFSFTMKTIFIMSFPFFILTSSMDLFFGYITRNSPAFNIFSISFQLKISLVFIFLMISIDSIAGQFKNIFLNLAQFN